MKPPVSPVAIDFLAGALKTNGFEVDFLDLSFESDVGSALQRAFDREPLLVGVTVRNVDDSFFATRDFCLARIRPLIRKIKTLTAAPVVLGGVGYSIFASAALEYCEADFGIRGDGEDALARFAEALRKNRSYNSVPGLVYRDEAGLQRNEPVPVNLARIDLSDRTTVDNLRYLKEGAMVGFETKRGCAASCSYCADPLSKGRVCRQRPPTQVAREIASLAERGIDYFHTCDSEFNIPRNHAAEVAREFIRFGLAEKIRWYAYMAPSFFDDELAALLRRSGCVGINFGADHCNPALLQTLGRTHTADSITQAARLCRKHDIAAMFDLLLGAPGETPETVREAIEFMKQINPACVGASMGLRIYPGTAMADSLAPLLQAGGPPIYGPSRDNPALLEPVYFLSPDLGDHPQQMLFDLVAGDERFFVASPERGEGDYNYNDNSVLSEAIRLGARGAFWDILRRRG